MKPSLALLITSCMILAACHSTRGNTADRGAASSAGSAGEAGDAEIEAQLEIANARLVNTPGSKHAEFVLKNASNSRLKFEFLVEAYGRTGDLLPGGRTAWVTLELGAHEGRDIRTADLPTGSESWRLVARRTRGD